jgi:hypothetical protein
VAYYVLSTPRRYADKTQDYCMVLDAVCSGQPGLTHVLYEVRGRLRASAQLQPELTVSHVLPGQSGAGRGHRLCGGQAARDARLLSDVRHTPTAVPSETDARQEE